MYKLLANIGAILITTTTLRAGVVMVSEVRVPSSGTRPVSIATSLVGQRNIRFDSGPSTNRTSTSAIFHCDRSSIINIDHERHTWSEVDMATLNQMATQLGQAMKEMQEQIQQMPPEQREMLQQMMADSGARLPDSSPPPKPQIIRTDRHKTISGYPCTLYELRENGRLTGEVWVAPWKATGIRRSDMAAFDAMKTFYRQLRESVEKAGVFIPSWDTAEVFDQAGGLPVLVREFDPNGKLLRETLTRSIIIRDLPPETFQPPPQYTRTEIPAVPTPGQ